MIKRPTIAAISWQLRDLYDKFEPKSEFEKGYLNDSYEEMQYYYPSPPGFTFFFNIDDYPIEFAEMLPPGAGGLQPGAEESHAGCPPFLWCDPTNPDTVDNGDSAIICFGGFCSSNISITLLEVSDDGFSLGSIVYFPAAHRACVTLKANLSSSEKGKAYIQAVDLDYAYSTMKYPYSDDYIPHPWAWKICTATCEPCDCDVVDNVAYDTENSDETIDQNSTATVIVTDGCGPFNWSVTGTGFSFDDSTTDERTNTLSADDTACGSATITITDKCGDSCTGYVRCTEGQWVQKESWSAGWKPDCSMNWCDSCAEDSPGCSHDMTQEIIEGKWKWWAISPACADIDSCEGWGSLVYKHTSWPGPECHELEYPEPPIAPENWPNNNSCNPHYPTCHGAGCYAASGFTYEWEC
jgi:hypothetical protein